MFSNTSVLRCLIWTQFHPPFTVCLSLSFQIPRKNYVIDPRWISQLWAEDRVGNETSRGCVSLATHPLCGEPGHLYCTFYRSDVVFLTSCFHLKNKTLHTMLFKVVSISPAYVLSVWYICGSQQYFLFELRTKVWILRFCCH